MTSKHYLSSSNPVPSGPRRFETGRIIVHPIALRDLTDDEIAEALERHFRCDWGDERYDLLEQEVAAMNAALAAGEKVVSRFEAPRPGPCPFYVVTNAERTETRVESEWDDTPEEQERTRRFLVDFAALLKKHELTIWKHSGTGCVCPAEPCLFRGEGFVLAVSEAADWVNAEEPDESKSPAGQRESDRSAAGR
jgi:hypothetical protein